MDKLLIDLKKALDTSSTNGNAYLDPTLLSRVISEQARIQPITRNVIPRKAWLGKTYTWDTQVTPGDAQTSTDGGSLSLIDGTYSQSSASMSFLYHTSYLSNPAIVAAQELVDLVTMRVGEATKAVLRMENNCIFNGDSNNSSFPGLAASLNGNPYFSNFAGVTANSAMFAEADTTLRAYGYTPSAWVVSPNLYSLIMQAAFNNVRFIGLADTAQYGYPLANNALAINGVPVIMDFFAQSFNSVSNSTMVAGATANSFKFAVGGAAVSNVQKAAGGNLAGTSWAAPVIKVSGSVVTNYTLAQNSDGTCSANFTATPSPTPTATFTYATDNAYCLSLNPADLVIAESMPIQVQTDLAKPVQTDEIPIRVQQYSVLAVRNPNAHIFAQSVIVPAVSAF
jgi:hypothetical protein